MPYPKHPKHDPQLEAMITLISALLPSAGAGVRDTMSLMDAAEAIGRAVVMLLGPMQRNKAIQMHARTLLLISLDFCTEAKAIALKTAAPEPVAKAIDEKIVLLTKEIAGLDRDVAKMNAQKDSG